MAAETVDTYTFNPEPRSTFSPENISGETKGQGQKMQPAKATGQPIRVSQVDSK